jgi:hypothetical protein
MLYLSCYYVYKSVIYYTCWVPTICVLNLTIFPCYSIMLLRRRRWTGILQRWVLGYVLPRLPFLWCYGVFHCSVSLIVILVFRDLIYVIIILYLWHLVICEHFWPYVWNNWSWVMIQWVLGFGIKTGYDRGCTCSWSWPFCSHSHLARQTRSFFIYAIWSQGVPVT